MKRQTERDAVKLYHLMRPHRGSESINAYESGKWIVTKSPELSKNYDQWIHLLINFLDV